MNRNWEEEFKLLEAGETRPESFPVADLFTMASSLAVRGNSEAAGRIQDWILAHPEVTREDRNRVLINQADAVRRGGKDRPADPDRALQMLTPMDTASAFNKAGLLFVQSEAYLLQGRNDEALKAKESLMRICEESPSEFPDDKPLHYLYGLIYTRFLAEGPTERVAEDLRRYRAMIDSATLDPGKKQYCEGAYHDMSGRFHKMRGEMDEAKESYQAYFDNAPSSAIKSVAAMEYLHAAWKSDPTDRSPEIMAMLEHFQKHQSEMQPAWVHACQKEYDFVQDQIARLTI